MQCTTDTIGKHTVKLMMKLLILSIITVFLKTTLFQKLFLNAQWISENPTLSLHPSLVCGKYTHQRESCIQHKTVQMERMQCLPGA